MTFSPRFAPRSTRPTRSTARGRLESGDAIFVDVRERAEWDEGHVPGAVHIPRGSLESRAEGLLPDRGQPLVVYCAVGSRSAFAAKTLEELGYVSVVSLAGGFTDWKRNGLPVEIPQTLDAQQRRRYSRHLLIPEVGEAGQEKLLNARVLLIGAGGLGSPASLYLAAAGVGTLGIVDDDVVDESNLQRQIVHSTERLGDSKAESAKRTIAALNPDVTVEVFAERLTTENADRILGAGWDVIVDGADNFPTRYLLNDASVFHGIPVVHGSIYRFEGQTTVFKPHEGPCYRCLFPEPPPPELAPSCAEGGVLGVLPGIVGSLQASEAIKVILDIGDPLVGRLLLFDALSTTFTEISLRRDPDCPVCGEHPSITEYIDYVEFCAGAMTRVRIPPTLRSEVGGEREVEGTGSTLRELLADLAARFPGLGAAGARRRRDRAVRERLRGQRGRAHARRPRHAAARRLERHPPPGDGRRRARAGALAARDGRIDAARGAPTSRPAGRSPLREARGREPDRLGEGPRREGDGRGRGGARRARARPRADRADEREHRHLARARREAQGLQADVRGSRERHRRSDCGCSSSTAPGSSSPRPRRARTAPCARRSAWPSRTRATRC